jgi:hypothetical protein
MARYGRACIRPLSALHFDDAALENEKSLESSE